MKQRRSKWSSADKRSYFSHSGFPASGEKFDSVEQTRSVNVVHLAVASRSC